MAVFSGSRAVGAGFSIIRREPAAFGVWCLVLVALHIAPFGLMIGSFLAALPQLAELSAEGAEPTPDQIFALQARLMAYYPLQMLGGLVCGVLLSGAIYRAVLEPDDRRFFYLRLSVAELWMSLGFIAFIGVTMVASIGLMIPVGILFAMAAATPDSPLVFVAAVFILAIVGVLIWLCLRFSLVPMASFAERRLVMPEAWAMASGQVVKMFGVGLILWIVMTVIQMVAVGIGFGVLFGGAGAFSLDALEGGRVDQLFGAIPAAVWLLLGLLAAVLYALYAVVCGAAWASIYRDLKSTAAEGV